MADLVSGLTSGKLRYQVADLAALPRAAVVIETASVGLSVLSGFVHTLRVDLW